MDRLTYEQFYHGYLKEQAYVLVKTEDGKIYNKGKACLIEDDAWERIKECKIIYWIYQEGWFTVVIEQPNPKKRNIENF